MNSLVRPIISRLSPGGANGRLSILIFHRVLPQPDPLFPDEVDVGRFDKICTWLKSWFEVLPLDEAILRLEAGTLPSRSACITFDDGYADNCEQAMPILQRHGLCATFFIATGFLGGGRMFNDTVIEAVRACAGPKLDLRGLSIEGIDQFDVRDVAARRRTIGQLIGALKYLPQSRRDEMTAELAARARASLPIDLMMSHDQVRRLRSGGMQLGAHTVSHPILARIDAASARDEIVTGKRALEAIIGDRVTLFAYPNGKPGEDYLPIHVEAVRAAGFGAAVSTHWGAGRRTSDLFQLPRFTPWDRGATRFGLRLAMNLRLDGRVG